MLIIYPPVPIKVVFMSDQLEAIELVQTTMQETRLVNELVIIEPKMMNFLHHYSANHSQRPGLIVLDANISNRRAYDILHELRSHISLLTIPIVILTDSLDTTDLTCALAHGVTGYFLKPLDSEQLHRVVRDVEEHWQNLAYAPSAN